MNITSSMPTGTPISEINNLKSVKVEIVTVSSLPTTNIKPYPIIYKVLDGTDASLFEYSNGNWISYGCTSVIELTKAEYEALTPEEQQRDIIYILTDVDGISGVIDGGGSSLQLLSYEEIDEIMGIISS